MTNKNCEILNDVTKTLIDSQKGYEKAYDMADDSYALRSQFQQRANERRQLVNEFQQQVRQYGEEPQTDGGITGTLHRQWSQFSSAFRDDEKAALEAVDTGEEHLAEQIENKLEEDGLDMNTRQLLQKAYTSAKQGERFAERVSA